jgi:transposase InsO family protein
MEIADQFKECILPFNKVLEVLELAKSTYHYQFKSISNRKRGRKASEYTFKKSGERVSNNQVVAEIEFELSQEFVDYGYLKTTYLLRDEYDYIINAKKVYNLMSINDLLNKSTKLSNNIKRQWVKDLVPKPELDFSYLEFDIKYFFVHGKRRNALVLTVIDVKSKWVLGHYMAWNIKEDNVKKLFNQIFDSYDLPEKIFVRSDNGSQFVALSVQKYFAEINSCKVVQEFIRPACPNQNAHIESYHSIAEKVICQKYSFENIQDLKETMDRFKEFYNFRRIHSGLGFKSPYKYLLQQGIDMKADPTEKSYFVPK